MPLSTEKDFEKMHKFFTFYPQITFPLDGWEVMKFTIFGLLPLHLLHSNFGLVFSEEKMLTDEGRCTTTDANP